MIPIMEQEFVDKNQWMDKQEFMDIMVVAQTTPGIFAIDMASHIGYKLKVYGAASWVRWASPSPLSSQS